VKAVVTATEALDGALKRREPAAECKARVAALAAAIDAVLAALPPPSTAPPIAAAVAIQ